MAEYFSTSPYYVTPISDSFFLDVMVNRPIPKEIDDQLFVINATYNLRPDLLSYDLYGTPQLWWVFAQRNPNTLVDPLGDFREGKSIYLPKISTLRSALGF